MNSLVLFTKTPEAGKVKTRLAASLTEEKAREIYVKLLNHTFRIASSLPVSRYIYNYPSILDLDADLSVSAERFNNCAQQGDDLGMRMSHAFKSLCHRYSKTILIGSDCSQLMPYHIIKAFDALNKADVVLGPAYDGGYYLIGMKSYDHRIFENMSWSHDKVLQDTIDRCKGNGIRYRLIDRLSDIDEIGDWLKWKI